MLLVWGASVGRGTRGLMLLAAMVWAGCGREAPEPIRVDPVSGRVESAGQSPSPQRTGTGFAPGPVLSGATERAPTGDLRTLERAESKPHVDAAAPELVWQPGFHQALRWSWAFDGQVTYRYKLPVARGGDRIRVAFRSGDGTAVIHRATVARAGVGGALAGPIVELTFSGGAAVSLKMNDRVMSDPVAFHVSPQDELYVSFEGDGAFARSAINAYPDSHAAWGAHAGKMTMPADGVSRHMLTGVNTIEVEAPRERVFVAVGDSITEGYVSGDDDARNAWPMLAGAMLGHPVVNGSVSGQGLWAGNEYADEDVLVLAGGVTDCVVLLGTNDLAADVTTKLQDRLTELFDTLRPICRVWAGTLLPKEKTDPGDLSLVNARRKTVNAWLRSNAVVHGVIDFEAATSAQGAPDTFLPGYGEDGIHPSLQGQSAMAAEAAKVLSAEP